MPGLWSRRYRNSSSSSPHAVASSRAESFGGTVIQVVVHQVWNGGGLFGRFGSTANQVVVHPTSALCVAKAGFGGTVIQVAVHHHGSSFLFVGSFGNTVKQAVAHPA